MYLATVAERLPSAFEGRVEIIFPYVFGSTAHGRTHARSDVNVVILNSALPLLADRVARSGDLAPLRRLLRAALEERVRPAGSGPRRPDLQIFPDWV